jgi:L-ascorbate metabolism protein UlaG (beta-lactamase superfamily)
MIYVIGIIALVIIVAFFLSERPAGPITYIPVNQDVSPVIPENYKGTPIDRKKRFLFEEAPFYQNFLKVMIWMPSHFWSVFFKNSKPLQVNKITDPEFLYGKDCLIWLGHASFFLRLNGKNLLIDPHFYDIYSYKRKTDNPIAPGLFKGINYLLLSHDHADHFDPRSISLLIKNNPRMEILTGKNMRNMINTETAMQPKVQEALWYERYDIKKTNSLEITFLPNRHYSKRIFYPFNSTLWGGFMISTPSIKIYFSGDSGYAGHFKTIGELFNPDLFIVGTGAYKPRWFMKDNHMDAKNAAQAFKDSGSSKMLPMHFGTFMLGNETIQEAERALEEMGVDYVKPEVGRIFTIGELKM